MNTDIKFEKKVIKPVVKEVKKYQKKYHSIPDKEEIGHLKIQTVNPFIRIISIIFGVFIIWWGYSIFAESSTLFIITGIAFFITGGIFIVLGFRGRRRELHSVLEAIDVFDGFGLVIESTADSIDF